MEFALYVCLCLAVTDRVIRAAVEAGSRDAKEVGRRTGAGTVCGGCRPAIEELLRRGGARGSTPGEPETTNEGSG